MMKVDFYLADLPASLSSPAHQVIRKTMIIITSEVIIDEKHWTEACELAQVHVAASRKEPGCISHRYLLSPEIDHCLFFYEEWKDRDAIDFHFQQSYSRAISKNFNLWAISEVIINFHHVETPV